MQERNSLEQAIDDLRARIERLEARSTDPDMPPDTGRLRASIDQRIQDQGIDPAARHVGQLSVQALLRIAGGTLTWTDDFAFEDLLAADPEALAKGIGGLAHPVRIALFKALLLGPKESAELLEIAGLNTTGQLYHHLQAMADVGLVERRSRNLWVSQNIGAFILLLAAGKALANWRGPD
jgi:ArsR family transcriptional regulator